MIEGRSRATYPILMVDSYPNDLIGLAAAAATDRLPILSFAMKEKNAHLPPHLNGTPIPEVAALAYRLQDVSRKVSGEPYFKHILRTVMHVSGEQVTAGMTPEDSRVLVATAYLHDALELKRQQRLPYTEADLMDDLLQAHVDAAEAGRIVALVAALTPPHEGKSLPDDNKYVQYKVRHFREKFNLEHPDARLLRIVKAADMLSNMEETADDIVRGLDDSRMGRSYGLRTWIFTVCTLVVAKDDPDNPLLLQLEEKIAHLMHLETQTVRVADQEWSAWLQPELAAA